MRIGLHEFTFEEPDLIQITVVGSIDVDEAVAGVKIMHDFARGKPKLYCISDVRRANGDMPRDAREVFVNGIKIIPIVAVLSIGGTFRDRVLMKVLTTAFKLLSRRPLELGAVEQEQDARTWLAERGCLACSEVSVSS